MNPLVSVVIPVYNGADYLKDAIASVLSQTYRNVEVIVVNDGSDDGGRTEDICLSYGGKIRYFKKENGGVSTALNKGIQCMRGEYFSWLAHDDYYYPDKLDRQISALICAGGKTEIVHGNYDIWNVSRDTVSGVRQEEAYPIALLTASVFPLLTGMVHACTALIHKSHLLRAGLFDENQPLTQDYDHLFRLMRGQRTLFVKEPLLRTRLHQRSGKAVNQGFALACARQHLGFGEQLSYAEIKAMGCSPSALFYKIACTVKSRAELPDVQRLLDKIKAMPTEDYAAGRERLLSFIKEHSGGRLRNICVFGAGFYGKLLRLELNGRGVDIGLFCDNDAKKQGTMILNVPCISFAELEKSKGETLVIVATADSEGMKQQLRQSSFPYVIAREIMEPLLLVCPVHCEQEHMI